MVQKRIFSKIIISFLIVISFSAGYFFAKSTQPSLFDIEGIYNKEFNKPADVDFSIFWDTWKILKEKYVGRGDFNYQNMVYGAVEGMVKSLNDPYTVFLSPQESKKFLEDVGGKFEGIGIEIGMKKGVLTVIAPLEDTPAQRAGIQAGDKIIKIDTAMTADLTLDEAVNLIRGPKGEKVILTIIRDGFDEAKEFSIVRDTIKIPIIKKEMLSSLSKTASKESNGDIAYVKLSHFTETSFSEFSQTANEILLSGAKGLVLDLRNNPGGYLDSAVDIAGWFVKSGELIVSEDFGNGKKIEYKSSGKAALGNLPIVILINRGSASASEILAGALRDQKNIKLIGEKSFGKGSVQEMENLKSGASIKITVAKWLTPKGVSINDNGLEPDVKVEFTKDDIEKDHDPQLNKAIEVIKSQL